MPTWIDPRANPAPPYSGPARPLASDPDELTGLVTAMKAGRFYSVEAWVRAGKPLQLAPGAEVGSRRHRSPLRLAMEAGSFDLVRLFLCNGYRMELEDDSPLNHALLNRHWELLDLLLDWGADPASASVGLILGTYSREIFERFAAAGIDLTDDDAMAEDLARSTRNRPLYGFAKNHREADARIQRALDVALGVAIDDKNDKAVSLCLWAGADPRRRIGGISDPPGDDPWGMTGIERAASAGVAKYLKKLGFDPDRDSVQRLYRHADDLDTLKILTGIAPPDDWTPILARIIQRVGFSERLGIPLASLLDLTGVFALGARLGALDRDLKRELRQLLLHLPEYEAVRLLRLLRQPEHMDPDAFIALIAHEKLATRYMEAPRRWGIDKAVMRGLAATRGVPGPVKRWAKAQVHPPRRPVMTHSYFETRDRAGRLYSREELYELVWSEPLVALAERFGISDNGLRKRCRAMAVPTPPRGYWEKLKRGAKLRRTPLPRLKGHREKDGLT